MLLENQAYVPTLAIRASEMNGLEFLPGATKNRMVPCFLLAPWVNSNCLQRAIDRVERAFPNRNYFLDMDRDFQITNLESEPQRELAELLNPRESYRNWSDFVAEHEWIWPCIQSRDQDEAEIRTQIEAFQNLERPYCLRIVRDRFPSNLSEIVTALAAAGTADFAIILDGGWTRDPLTLAVWFAGLITESFQAIDAQVPIILSCTSIPKMFGNVSGRYREPFNNRQLIERVARQTNRARITYGDWGSTRPREGGGFASRPLDRIDYPTRDAWVFARNKDKDWDFKRAAAEVVGSSDWNGDLGIWGEEMIQQTTINKQLGIDTPQKNLASRVNIHLHRQSFYDESDLGSINFDEDWED